MQKKKLTIITIISMIVSLLLITIGLSFAYFTANITGTENSTTIQATGGIMNITYNNGKDINAPNIKPSNNPFGTKEFTLNGNSTTNTNMHYHIILVVEENTFSENAITYKLISTNTNDNGEVAPSTNKIGIVHGTHELFLGGGMFESPSNNNIHSYALELYFPDTGKNQNEDMEKTFKAHIDIKEGDYIYEGYNEDKGVNHPVLFTGMTPIKWDEYNNEINTTEDDSDWYNYDEKRWANAKSQDGSYWVWIPRYAYKIESCYHMSGADCLATTGKEAGDIDIKFLKGTSKVSTDNLIVETSGYLPNEKDTSMHHFLHPTFKYSDLGFWMAKFEPTAAEGLDSGIEDGSCSVLDNVSTKFPKIIPNETSWRCINISNAYKTSLGMKDNAIYGWNSTKIDTHMITNLEWGAVVYLSKSKYGAHDEEVWNNSYTGFQTGCSGPSVNASNQPTCDGYEYDTENGVKASTTHNISGVYDMSGGSWERVMGNYNYMVGSSGFGSEELLLINSKLINHYYTATEELNNNYGVDYVKTIYGDALYETSNNAARHNGSSWTVGSGNNSWYSDYSYLPWVPSTTWLSRGNYMGHALSSGVFSFNNALGDAHWADSFRPVLCPL